MRKEKRSLEEKMGESQFDLSKDEALDLYFKMVLTRQTEDKHEELYQKQVVPVYTHLGTGQEAVGCGVSTLLRRDDYLIGTHRGVAEVVGKGMRVKDIYLEAGSTLHQGDGLAFICTALS
jgi:TPP-dependent pyruvate/acetoin dehydrogenase alpha subunit